MRRKNLEVYQAALKTGSGKTRDWKSIQEKPVEDTIARLSF
jgi:hypothetical protein